MTSAKIKHKNNITLSAKMSKDREVQSGEVAWVSLLLEYGSELSVCKFILVNIWQVQAISAAAVNMGSLYP